MTTRLRACDLAVCEGMCCHDGVYLTPEEERRLRRLVFQRRRELPHLPDRCFEGGKTAVAPYVYRARPAHFTDTRCVFALADARCSLQVLAVADGQHPWAYKPRACWMHPLREGAHEGATRLLPPPEDPASDWDRAEGYPGYVTFTECGRHRPDGEPWDVVLAEEIVYWRRG